MLLTPRMRSRLADLDPWLRSAARHNQGARRILIRHVREEVPLATTLAELRAYLIAQGYADLGWPAGEAERLQVLRDMCTMGL